MAQIHISYPRETSLADVMLVAQKLREYKHTVTYWDKGTYNKEWLETADAMVIMLPENGWSIKTGTLPIGMYSEYSRAKQANKDMFLSYKLRGSGVIQIYELLICDNNISGKAGTYNHIVLYKGKPKLSNCVTYPNVNDYKNSEGCVIRENPSKKYGAKDVGIDPMSYKPTSLSDYKMVIVDYSQPDIRLLLRR